LITSLTTPRHFFSGSTTGIPGFGTIDSDEIKYDEEDFNLFPKLRDHFHSGEKSQFRFEERLEEVNNPATGEVTG